MDFLQFFSPNYNYIFLYCLLLFDTIVGLHAMDEKNGSMTFSLESEHGFYM